MSSAHHSFLTIILTDKQLQSALVSNDGQGIQLKEFSGIHSYFDRQDLLEQLDKSLQELGPDSQDVVEAVFAFDQEWLETGDLDDAKKAVIKEVTESLTLEPIGQVSVPVALAEARLIGDEHDSCLIVSLKEQSFELIFVKHGAFVDLIRVGRSATIVDDMAEALARAARHLTSEHSYFPSKMLLTSIALSIKDLESLKKQLDAVDWAANPGFNQSPTIVVLEADYMVKSISMSAGKIFNKEAFLARLPSSAASVDTVATHELPQSEEVTEKRSQVTFSSSPTPAPKEEYALEPTQASSFGIRFDHTQLPSSSPATADFNQSSLEDDAPHPRHETIVPQARSPWKRFYLAHRKMILLGFASGLLGLVAVFAVFALFFSKVMVLITPEESLLQKSVRITLDPTVSASNFDQALLQASLANRTITGQDVLATTGIGLIGEKAKGKVMIYNKTEEEAKLSAGTLLSKDGIEFLLDQETTVPAAVEKDGGDGVNYGKTEAAITAKDIGADANFNKETKLRVAEYFDDAFTATALDTFAGGSSREVRVVAQADQDTLRKQLEQKLIADASKELESESKDGTYLVPTGLTKLLKTEFSAEVGTETESLTLNLTVEVEVVKYLASDLKQLGLALLEKELPAGFVLLDEDPSLLSDKAEPASGSSRINLNADLSAKAVAQLDTVALQGQILGKDWLEAEELLVNHGDIKSASVQFKPAFLSGILRQLPTDPNRVVVQLTK